MTSNVWGSLPSPNSYVQMRQRGDEVTHTQTDGVAAALLQAHLTTDVSRELDQILLHAYGSTSCHILPSAAYLTDFSY